MLPEKITVVIPAQEFSDSKYMGSGQPCYLEEALQKAGFKSAQVGGSGDTRIDEVKYRPTEPFNSFTVEKSFSRGKSITVTLVQRKTNQLIFSTN